MKPKRREFLKAVGAAATVGIAGCGGGGGGDGGGGSTPSPTQGDPEEVVGGSDTATPSDGEGSGGGTDEFWEAQDERLKEAAEKAPDEPTLVMYYNYRPDGFQQMQEDFKSYAQEEYGFTPDIEFTRAAAAKVASRVENEKRSGQLDASFVGVSSPGAVLDWTERGWTEEWLPPVLQKYPDAVVLQDNYMHTGTWWYPMCITVGPGVTDGDTPAPEGYAQMVQMSEFQGNMTSYDMMLGGGASWYWTSFMHDKLTNDGPVAGLNEAPSWQEFVRNFYEQDPFFSPSSFNMIQQVGREEYDGHISSLSGWSILLRDTKDVPVTEIYPESGVPMFFNSEALFKDAPALNTAMLFQNWWLGEQPQKKYTRIEYCYSPHPNVEGIGATDLGKPLSEINATLPKWQKYAEMRPDLLSEIEQIKNSV